MKLVQLNAWGGRLEHQIGDFLKAEAPDILCLQEAISYPGDGTGLFITIDMIQSEYNLPHLAFEPVFSFNYMDGIARFGNAILSKNPITYNNAVFTHMEHVENFVWGKHSANMRNFVHAVIETSPGQPCNVLTHHGYWIPHHKNGTSETDQQMEQLARYIKQLEGPIILTGDFNLAPDSTSLKKLNSMLNNLCIENNIKTTRTDLTFKTETCDYIFINEDIAVQRFSIANKTISDHKALILEFRI